MTNKIEAIFKSEEDVCPDCGGIMKSTGAKKGKGAKAIGNEDGDEPQAGKKAKPGTVQKKGDMSGHVGTGTKDGTVQRKGTQPSNPTVEKAMFPVNSHYAATEYAGLNEDNALSKSIEHGSEDLYFPPARNLAMEKESADIRKASECDDESESDTGDEGGSEEESASESE